MLCLTSQVFSVISLSPSLTVHLRDKKTFPSLAGFNGLVLLEACWLCNKQLFQQKRSKGVLLYPWRLPL